MAVVFTYDPPDTSQSNVIVGPTAWHTSPVWSYTFSDFNGYFMIAYEYTYATTRDSTGRLTAINTNFANLYNEFAYGVSKTWTGSGSGDWYAKTQVQQGQVVVMLASLAQLVANVQGPWVDFIPPPPDLASGQSWSVEYEGLMPGRTQAPDVMDMRDLTIHMAVEGNPNSGYTPAGGHARISLVPPSLLPARQAPNPQSGSLFTNSGSFTQKATCDFGSVSAGVETVAVHLDVQNDCRIYQTAFGGQGWAELVFDVTSSGIPWVGPPAGWNFGSQGVYTESWDAAMDMYWYQGQPGYSVTSVDLTWQPPRWRYVYGPPSYPDTGNVVGDVDRQDLKFRPRVPNGGNTFNNETGFGWSYSYSTGWTYGPTQRQGVVFE